MSNRYVAVNWNRQKRLYDITVALAVLGLVALFFVLTLLSHPGLTAETGLIRGLGLTAFVLLHVILCIGPLARLNPAFLPLLYNRRHLGVSLCLLALAHAGFATFQYHALGDRNALVSVLSANQALGSAAGFPFELLGVAALVILVLMAATSHDFWLAVLSPRVWKTLHMLVYVAYALLVGHVGLGYFQAETGPVVPLLLALGALLVLGLHLAAAVRERRGDREAAAGEWVTVCPPAEIPEGRAKLVMAGGERVAVYRHAGKLSAVSNVCKHQNGPLGEGRIVDGCITCPWHGYQYLPESGTSPPPFDDKVPTYDVRIAEGQVAVRRAPNPAGTRVEPVAAGPAAPGPAERLFYVGYQPRAPRELARRTRNAVLAILLLAAGSLSALALSQAPFAGSRFEYGSPREVSGRLLLEPYPRLEEPGPQGVTQYLLAGAGKHGAVLAPALDGRLVRLRGTLAQRGNARLLEVDSIAPAEGAPPAALPQLALGEFSLRGEIVDSKCWTGVMNPGQGKTHLGCAVRCLSGGLPPLLMITDGTGRESRLILTDPGGGPLSREVLPAVGRPVAVTGQVFREGELLFLRAAPEAIRVLP